MGQVTWLHYCFNKQWWKICNVVELIRGVSTNEFKHEYWQISPYIGQEPQFFQHQLLWQWVQRNMCSPLAIPRLIGSMNGWTMPIWCFSYMNIFTSMSAWIRGVTIVVPIVGYVRGSKLSSNVQPTFTIFFFGMTHMYPSIGVHVIFVFRSFRIMPQCLLNILIIVLNCGW